jgi:hypothetical protein
VRGLSGTLYGGRGTSCDPRPTGDEAGLASSARRAGPEHAPVSSTGVVRGYHDAERESRFAGAGARFGRFAPPIERSVLRREGTETWSREMRALSTPAACLCAG